MSMLAEPKRKVQWSLTPYSRTWSQDTNKFGQKMLEKMGWQQGEGLGKLRDGITDPIKANFKHGNTGVGWYGSQTGDFVPYQGDFDSLLKNLKSSHGVPTNASKEQVSLESKSKSSRKRVHYQKFIRGKDISQYSLEDKLSVLGKKIENAEEASDNLGNDTSQHSWSDGSSGCPISNPTFTSSTNMVDYFSTLTKRRKMIKDESNDNTEPPETSQTEVTSIRSTDEAVYDADEIAYQTDEAAYNSPHMETGICSNKFACLDAKACRRKRKNQKKKEKKRMREAEKIAKEMCNNMNSSLKDDETSSDDIARQHTTGCKDDDESFHNISSNHASLKSCLRLSTSFSSVKSVTFNDEVSYEIIPPRSTDNEEDTEESADLDENDPLSSSDDQLPSLEKNTVTKTEKTAKKRNSYDTSPPKEKSPSERVSMQKYMSLPVFGGSTIGRNTDSWSVTLKMAEKMSRYNSVMESISKHSVLCTTNLLEIRGYGN